MLATALLRATPADLAALPESAFGKLAAAAKRAESAPEVPRRQILSQWASEITPTRPEWLWLHWLLLGALNLCIGRQGSGKTTFVAHVVAALTNGVPLPGDPAGLAPYSVGFLSLEEPRDRVVARLHAAGADRARVRILDDVQDLDDEGKPYRRRWTLPGDIAVLGEAILDHDLQLVVVDGLGYTISGDSHNYAVVGSALSALAGMAERTGAAVLGLVHPPKGASDAVTSAIGSTAWTSVPRVTWNLGADPNDESGVHRVVAVGKSNYKQPSSGLTFTIGDDPEFQVGYVAGLRPSGITADEITAAPVSQEERGERADARDYLRQMLSDGPMDSAVVIAEARAAGISERTIKRARADLHVVATRRADVNGKIAGWSLELPNDHKASGPSTGPALALWPSGTTGHHQDKESVSVPEGQRRESGTLDLGASS